MKISEFRKLEEVKRGDGRRRIVDWKKVLEKIVDKVVFDKKEFEKIVLEMFKDKKKVSYSEMYRVLDKWSKEGYIVESRVDKKGKVWYGVFRNEKKDNPQSVKKIWMFPVLHSLT